MFIVPNFRLKMCNFILLLFLFNIFKKGYFKIKTTEKNSYEIN